MTDHSQKTPRCVAANAAIEVPTLQFCFAVKVLKKLGIVTIMSQFLFVRCK
jgi:hypothetical protein